MKIGLVADSQITTLRGTVDSGMREKAADRLVRVAIRPFAVELWSHEILDQILEKMVAGENKPDLILYLGDLANSGCVDEITAGLRILEKYRDGKANVPIFLVVGNHDYLGSGNTEPENPRRKLCQKPEIGIDAPNGFFSKYDIIKRFSEFNQKSAAKLSADFKYTDNIADVRALYEIRGSTCEDHKRYYLAGKIAYKSAETGHTAEIILADTSDYRDAFSLRIASRDCKKGYGFWGAKGSISEKNRKNKDPQKPEYLESQIEYVRKNLGTGADKPDFRFFASHYPPDRFHTFGLLSKIGISILRISPFRKRLATWWMLGVKNYWLYGHTHIPEPKFTRISIDSEREFTAFNVGSTTDHEPHAVVYGDLTGDDAKKNAKDPEGPQYEKISLNVPKADIDEIKADLRELNRPENMESFHRSGNSYVLDKPGYKRTCRVKKGIASGMTLLGLNKSYRKSCWMPQSNRWAEYNLWRFINEKKGEPRTSGGSAWTEPELIRTLFMIATDFETNGKQE
ncbi:MAG: metallophosphoesterase [Acidobacteria bacterium]|nr:metallophosphoesterase [Acidobacteriota bacterium]